MTSNVVFVGNISWSMTEETLAEAFKSFGKVSSSRIITFKDGRSKGYGYVEFESSASAVAALEMNGSEVEGREIKVDLSSPKPTEKTGPSSKTLAIGNLSYELTKPELYEILSKYGAIVDLNIGEDREKMRLKGYGYVTFKTIEAAEAAVKLDGTRIKDRSIRVEFKATNILFLGNLSFEVTESQIRELFGNNCIVRLPTYEDGRSKGFGYVEFEDENVGREMLQKYNGKELMGRNMKLDFSSSKNESDGRRGRGRGSGRNRGRRGY